jgi:hypothetical protein
MVFRIAACCAFLSLCIPAPVRAEEDPGEIGRKIRPLRCSRAGGSSFALEELKGKKAVVVVFLSFDCPISNSYVAPLSDLARAYRDMDVAFLGVCAAGEEALARSGKEFRPGFPVVRDDRGEAVNAFRAEKTPECFVLDGGLVLRYRGRIDDAFADRLRPNKEVSRRDLVAALDAVLVGKPVRAPIVPAVGCPIPRTTTAGKPTTSLTYYRDVLPILQNHCQGCHRPGETGPFSLLTYPQAVRWAADIKEYTRSRKMPPWQPVEGVEFVGERKLTAREISTLAAWADGGTPAGDPRDAPPEKKFAEGWLRGEPDLVLTPKEEMILGPTGGDLFRCFVLPTNLPKDRFVVAYEVRPGNRRVVHHTLHFLDGRGRARRLEQRARERALTTDRDRGPGYSMMMGPGFFPPDGDVGGWAPGLTPYHLPEGVGFYLPKGCDLVMQIHYHRTGKEERDGTRMGLYFAKKPGTQALQSLAIPGLLLAIPAGADNYPVRGSLWVAEDCTLHTVTPHMHLLGKKIKITMTPPGAGTTVLLGIDQWDFNRQEAYILKKSLRVPAGTRFDVSAVYDNSDRNPSNPNHPPRTVLLGEQTTNEMCFGFVGLTPDKPGPVGFRLSPGSFLLRRPGLLPAVKAEKESGR